MNREPQAAEETASRTQDLPEGYGGACAPGVASLALQCFELIERWEAQLDAIEREVGRLDAVMGRALQSLGN